MQNGCEHRWKRVRSDWCQAGSTASAVRRSWQRQTFMALATQRTLMSQTRPVGLLPLWRRRKLTSEALRIRTHSRHSRAALARRQLVKRNLRHAASTMHTRANETRAFYDTTVDRNKSLLLVTWPRIALFLRWCRTASLAEQQVRNRFDLEEQDRIFSCKENALYGFRPRCWTCEQLNTPFPVINQAKPILMAVALATFDCRLFAKK